MYELLTYHPTAHEKIGDGVVAIGWGVNPEFPDTRSFYCRLKNGDKVPWSARKCVDTIFPKDDAVGASRDAKRKRERDMRVADPSARAGFIPGSILLLQQLPPGTRMSEVKGLFPRDLEVR